MSVIGMPLGSLTMAHATLAWSLWTTGGCNQLLRIALGAKPQPRLHQHPHLAAHPCCPTPADVLSMLPFVQLLSSAANEEQQQACAEVLLAALREPQSAVARVVRTIAANTLGGV